MSPKKKKNLTWHMHVEFCYGFYSWNSVPIPNQWKFLNIFTKWQITLKIEYIWWIQIFRDNRCFFYSISFHVDIRFQGKGIMYHYPVDFLDYCEKMNLRGKHNDCQWIILIKMVLKWIKKNSLQIWLYNATSLLRLKIYNLYTGISLKSEWQITILQYTFKTKPVIIARFRILTIPLIMNQ